MPVKFEVSRRADNLISITQWNGNSGFTIEIPDTHAHGLLMALYNAISSSDAKFSMVVGT